MVNKKGAIELSIGTIVVLVIAMTMLIMGIVLVRNIMCSGILITEDLEEGVKNEVRNLFGANAFGVKCVGEGGQEINLGGGGRRNLICMIKTDAQADYTINVNSVESLTDGVADTTMEGWVLDQDFSGKVSPGGTGYEALFLILNLPRNVPASTMKIISESTNSATGATQTHQSIIDITPAGTIQTAVC